MILKPEDPNQMEFVCRSELISEEPLVKTVDAIVNSLDLKGLYGRYSESGRSFYDPGMLLKVLFFGYCDRVRSSRELSRHIRYDIRYRYYCGSLHPDFRTINRFRKDNLDLLGDYFAQIVMLIQKKGLLDSSLLCLDGTKIRASANGRSRNRKEIYKKLEHCLRKQLAADIEAEETDEEMSSDGGSVTDRDARYMKTSEGGIRLGYNSQIMVDRNQMIVTVDVSNNADDSVQFRSMVTQSYDNLGGGIDMVAADGGYRSGANLKYADAKGIDLYVPVSKTGNVPDSRFHRDEFVYEKQSDSFRCPAGERLNYHRARRRKGIYSRIYRGSPEVCGVCQFRDSCTKRMVRELQVSEYYKYEQAMKAKLDTASGRFTYDQRKCLVEPVFGNIKFNLGFVRYALRGLNKVSGEFLLICIAHNLKKLAALCGKSRSEAENMTTNQLILSVKMVLEIIMAVFKSKYAVFNL